MHFGRCLAGLGWVGLAGVLTLAAAEKKLPIEQTSNDLIEISATALLDKEQIRQELGAELSDGIVVLKVTIRPVSDKPIQVSLDDFSLLSGKDGQRSQPYAPTQIAGASTLVVTSSGARNGGIMGNRGGPTWGGASGAPRRLPGNGGGIGNSSEPAAAEAKVENAAADAKPNPLLAVLKEKVLQEKEITQPITGLLYFQMEGKLKPKDLELHYRGPAGRLGMRFRP